MLDRTDSNLLTLAFVSLLALPVIGCSGDGPGGVAAPVRAATGSESAGSRPEVPNLLPMLDRNAATSTPHRTPEKRRVAVTVPPEVQAKWKAVELSMTPPDGQAQQAKVAVGGEIALRKSPSVVHVLAFLPAFQITDAGATSSTNELDNPAVLVRLRERDQTIAEGWVFQKLPDFNTFKSDKVRIELKGATTRK
jgi:hypothetical protein